MKSGIPSLLPVGDTSERASSAEDISPNSYLNVDGEASSSRTSQETRRSTNSRVQLAADQPLTIHGKPRERVYVACSQWFVAVSIAAALIINAPP